MELFEFSEEFLQSPEFLFFIKMNSNGENSNLGEAGNVECAAIISEI